MVLISSRELEWLKCLNNKKEFRYAGKRQYKRKIKNLIPKLPEKINLVFKEISELTNSLQYIECDENDVEKILSTLRNGVLELLGPFPLFEIPKILKDAEKKFYKGDRELSSIFSATNLASKLILRRLRMINVHPGISWGETNDIQDELDIDKNVFKTYKNGEIYADVNILIKNIKKVSNKKLQSIVNKIINSNEYWKNRKFLVDEKYINSNQHAQKLLKNIIEKPNILKKFRYWETIKEFFKRGILYSQELSEDEVIELFRKSARKESKECLLSKKMGLDRTTCECLFRTSTINEKFKGKFTSLKLTGYGRALTKKLPSI